MIEKMETPSLLALQIENDVWAKKNFPGQTPGQMLLGIFEELGELVEASAKESRELIEDAAADFMVYAASYCNHKGWAMQEIWDARARRDSDTPFPRMAEFVVIVGKLSHHHLKAEQKIRGKAELHEQKGKEWLGYLFASVESFATRHLVAPDLPRIACDVWRLEVQPRSWEQKGEVEPVRASEEV